MSQLTGHSSTEAAVGEAMLKKCEKGQSIYMPMEPMIN